MAKKTYHISDEDFAEIVKINKEGGDPVMFTSNGTRIGLDLQDKINHFWDNKGREYGFDWRTIEAIDNRNFTAEELIKKEKQ